MEGAIAQITTQIESLKGERVKLLVICHFAKNLKELLLLNVF